MRLGSIEFINSLPVDHGLASGEVSFQGSVVSGTPVELNQKLLKSELDISPVSAFFYAEHQSDFLMLPDLSISSLSGVESVLLFSRLKFRNLEGAVIAVTGQGRTTPALFEMISWLRYGFRPRFRTSKIQLSDIPKDADAMLLIGDEALIAKQHLKDSNIEIIDLAAEWRKWTKRPIVFAVWAVRRDFFKREPEKVFETHSALLQSRDWGLKNLDAIYDASEQKTGLPRPVLQSYFSRLSYGLDEELRTGMRLYFDYAVKCRLLKPVKEFETIHTMAGVS